MPADLVLVDTSIWIEYLRDRQFSQGLMLRKMMESGHARITGLVAAELLQGAKSQTDQDAVETIIATTENLLESMEVWKRAGNLAGLLRKKGITISMMDCLIASLAVHHKTRLMTLDKHFEQIARYFPLELIHY